MPPIVQRGFLRGLDASTDKFTQPRGSVPFISNMVFSKRGSLKTVDGNTPLPGNPLPPQALMTGSSIDPGAMLAILEYLSPGSSANGHIYYLQEFFTATGDAGQLGAPPGLSVNGANVGGGILAPGTVYNYKVLVSAQGYSTASVVSHDPGGGNNANVLQWTPVSGAVGYVVLRDDGFGNYFEVAFVSQPDFAQLLTVPQGGVTVSFTDDGHTTLGPWGSTDTNTTGGYTLLRTLPFAAGEYTAPQTLAKLPIVGGGIIDPNGGLNYLTPDIHLIKGAVGLVPGLLQFADKVIVLLGNGIRPMYVTPASGLVSPFTNTFTANYANWQASVTYLVGDIIVPTVANGHYYIATQGGESNGVEPVFPTTTDNTINDKQVVWQEAGIVAAISAPSGAARGINHAGSLWVFNTSPTNTADLLDGPSALRASDVNNILSWNPLNAAFIGKDDGQQGMGVASFTIAEAGIPPIGSLIVFKDFSAYQIVGFFGSPNFNIQQLPTDMGCIAPASIKFIPSYGLIRMTHLGFSIYDGVRDRLVSEPIRAYIFGSSSISPIQAQGLCLMCGGMAADPPMYIAAGPITTDTDSFSRLFFYDLILKAWAIIDIPTTVSPKSFIRTMGILHSNRLGLPPPFTIVGGSANNSIQIIQKGGTAWGMFTSSIPISWAFTTPEVFNSDAPDAEMQFDSIIVRGINTDGNPITVTVNLQTESGYIADPKTYAVGPGEFEIFVGVNETCLSANALISGTGRVEIASVTWNAKPLPSGIPSVIT